MGVFGDAPVLRGRKGLAQAGIRFSARLQLGQALKGRHRFREATELAVGSAKKGKTFGIFRIGVDARRQAVDQSVDIALRQAVFGLKGGKLGGFRIGRADLDIGADGNQRHEDGGDGDAEPARAIGAGMNFFGRRAARGEDTPLNLQTRRVGLSGG